MKLTVLKELYPIGESLDILDALIEQLWAAPDEQAARQLLETYPAS